MKLAIIGSREYHDFQTAVEVFGMTSRRYGVDQWDSIVSGGASGADFIGKKLATLNAIPYVEFPADWARYGKRAGVIRNKDIIQHSDIVLALWDGESRGTANALEWAKRFGRRTSVFNFKTNKLKHNYFGINNLFE